MRSFNLFELEHKEYLFICRAYAQPNNPLSNCLTCLNCPSLHIQGPQSWKYSSWRRWLSANCWYSVH